MKTAKSFILPIILATLFFTSCSDYDNDYTVNQIQYEKAFYDVFGEIDPNQDWNLVKQLAKRNGGKSTRVATFDNRNHYIFPIKENNKIVDFEFMHEAQGVTATIVPGFPADYDKKYHVKFTQDGPEEVFDTKEALIDYMNNNGKNEIFPAGDVTNEEIEYVSRWFRAHQLGENHDFPFTQFFIQQISSDVDLTEYPTWDDVTNTEIGTAGVQATAAEYDEYGNYRGQKDLNYTMNNLCVYDKNGYAHINQFNNGNGQSANFRPLESEVNRNGRIINFVSLNGDLVDVSYQSPDGGNGNGVYKDHWTLQYLSFDINGHHYEGYYLALDYDFDAMQGQMAIKKRDYHFNNWIVKITPAYSSPEFTTRTVTSQVLESGLLVCEDLGDHDFDFNDIVLKLEHKRITTMNEGNVQNHDDKFVITAMAAGGTLPSYVYYKPLRAESADRNNPEVSDYLWVWLDYAADEKDMTNGIHHMVSGEQGNLSPLNVGESFPDNGEGHVWEIDINDAIGLIKTSTDRDKKTGTPIKEYADRYVSYVFDFSRIRIYVGDSDTTKAVRIEPINHGIDSKADNSSAYKTANVPQMMLLPEEFEWAQECVPIANAYPNFRGWVRNAEDNIYWYKIGNTDSITVRTGNASGNVVGGGDNGNNNGGDNGGGDNTGQQQNADPELHWTNEISIVEYSTTIGYDTKSNGGVWVSLSDYNLADVTLDSKNKTLTIVPKPNANGTLVITLHQSNSGNDYRESSITMTVTVGKKEDTGKDDTENGKQITKISARSSGLSPALGSENNRWLTTGYKIEKTEFDGYNSGVTLTIKNTFEDNVGWSIGTSYVSQWGDNGDNVKWVQSNKYGNPYLQITLTKEQVEAAKTYGFQLYSQNEITDLQIYIK